MTKKTIRRAALRVTAILIKSRYESVRILFMASLIATAAVAQSQTLPADVDPQSFSRLPLLQRDQMTGEALRIYDAVAGKDPSGNQRPVPPIGPPAISLYSPGVAEPMSKLIQYLRNTVVGPAMFEISALIAAREFDDNYVWPGHEAAAKRAQVDQKTIDAIKFDRPLGGLPEKDALVVRFGRALFRDHVVSPELYTNLVETFGKQGMVELTAIMGNYAMASVMLRAVDQQTPNANSKLPPIKR